MFDVCWQVYVKMQDITRYPAKIKELVAAVKTKAGIKSAVSSTPCKFSSVQDGICALGKAHMNSTPLSEVPPTLRLKQFQCWSD